MHIEAWVHKLFSCRRLHSFFGHGKDPCDLRVKAKGLAILFIDDLIMGPGLTHSRAAPSL